MQTLMYVLIIALFALQVAANVGFWVHLKRGRANSFFDKLMAWRHVTHIAKELVQDSDVERFLVLMLTNGGGDPHPGARLYATALVNELDDTYQHKHRDYDQVEVDTDYIERVIRARASGAQRMHVSVMGDSLLKRFYDAEGVRYAELYYLFSTERETYFCSAATYSNEHLAGAQGDISLALNAIKKALSGVYREVRAKSAKGTK